MYLEIISPEATLFTGEVDSVKVPGSAGDFQMLNNHAPIVSTLKKGIVKISGKIDLDQELIKNKFEKKDANTFLFKINSGTIEMRNNKLILLAE